MSARRRPAGDAGHTESRFVRHRRNLLGTSPTIQQLALLDVEHDIDTLVNIFAQFPGLLELLPDEDDTSATRVWNEYRRSAGLASAFPTPTRLAEARETLEASPPMFLR